MSDLSNGILVRHTAFGIGRVVALEPDAVHVFFPAGEKRFATKLRLPAARAFLRTDGVPPDAWLQGLSAFTLDDETRRYALAATWLTYDQAIAQFVAANPGGFEGPDYVEGDRAPLWRAAHEAWVRTLGNGEGERLLADGDLDEIRRRVLAVQRHVAPLHPDSDADALAEALSDLSATGPFFERLFALLSVPSPNRARFDKLFASVAALPGDPSASWMVATILPFLAAPDRHPFLRPSTVRPGAQRLGCDLRWSDTPAWATFASLRALATKLLAALKPIGARDLVDVEEFLHHTATARGRGGKSKEGARKSRPTRAAAAAKPTAVAKAAPAAKAAPPAKGKATARPATAAAKAVKAVKAAKPAKAVKPAHRGAAKAASRKGAKQAQGRVVKASRSVSAKPRAAAARVRRRPAVSSRSR